MSAVQQALAALVTATPGVTYATLDPANKGAGITLSGGNLTVTASAANQQVFSTISKLSGKWYWEAEVTSGVLIFFGIASSSSSTSVSPGFDSFSVSYRSNTGNVSWNSSTVASGAAFTTGDIVGMALDMTSGTIAFYKNNSFQATYSFSIGSPVFAVGGGSAAGVVGFIFNFGATPLTYTPPAGFNAGLYV